MCEGDWAFRAHWDRVQTSSVDYCDLSIRIHSMVVNHSNLPLKIQTTKIRLLAVKI